MDEYIWMDEWMEGSVIGPLLFFIYLRPLSLIISKFPQIKFILNIIADDIIIYQTLQLNNNNNSLIALIIYATG